MTAQHVPHAPLWRRVISLPQTRLGWWAAGLAGPSLVLTLFFYVSDVLGWTFLRPDVVAETGSSDQYPLLILAWLSSAVAGAVVGLIAVARERSCLVWVAQVPGLIFFAYFIWGVSSMLIGKDANPWVTFPIAVLLWAVMVFNILWSTRKSGEPR